MELKINQAALIFDVGKDEQQDESYCPEWVVP
jgi:hypothetical protein